MAALGKFPTDERLYELGVTLGRGATAIVQEAICKNFNPPQKCAIKVINLDNHSTEKELLDEIQLMSKCHHENIVGYYCCFVVKRDLWLVMTLLDAGSVLDLIKCREKSAVQQQLSQSKLMDIPFNEVQIATIMQATLRGLQYLHSAGHIHRDIKAGNILMSTNGDVQVADFGVCALQNHPLMRGSKRTTFVGTPCWMAPEVMDSDCIGYDNKADIWSFGITAIELALGKAPLYNYQPLKVILLTLQNPPPKLEDQGCKRFSKELKKMVNSCLQKEPSKRINASVLLKDGFFKKAKGKECIRMMLLEVPALKDRIRVRQSTKHQSGDNESKRSKPRSGTFKRGPDGLFAFELDSDSEDEKMDQQIQQSQKIEIPQTNIQPELITLSLRIRSSTDELNDVKFPLMKGKEEDSPDAVALEMVGQHLVNPIDQVIVASHLEKVIETKQRQLFALPSIPEAERDEGEFIGYALLTMVDNE